VVEILADLAAHGKTVILAIHQPRYTVFTLFDNLMLLAEGEMVFQVPSSFPPSTAPSCLFLPPDLLVFRFLETSAYFLWRPPHGPRALGSLPDAATHPPSLPPSLPPVGPGQGRRGIFREAELPLRGLQQPVRLFHGRGLQRGVEEERGGREGGRGLWRNRRGWGGGGGR
jgi:energy-coupling factor transporter ATP-binding protein EcfA2